MIVVWLVPKMECLKPYVDIVNLTTFENLDIFQYGGVSTGSEYFLNSEARVSYIFPCNFCIHYISEYITIQAIL